MSDGDKGIMTVSDDRLREVAELIDVPVEVIRDPERFAETEAGQSLMLLRSFQRITDPDVRKRCVRYVATHAAMDETQNAIDAGLIRRNER